MKSITDIKANVKFKWDHHNCKFAPGDRVTVNKHGGLDYNSKKIKDRVSLPGNVLAVSCGGDGNIRTRIRFCPQGRRTLNNRMFTRYFVQFDDGEIIGIHSHHLDKFRSDLKKEHEGWYKCYQAIANS
jgi:hypothetical protein